MSGSTRAELRRRSGAPVADRPAVVWGRAASMPGSTDAAPRAAATAPAVPAPVEPSVPEAVVPVAAEPELPSSADVVAPVPTVEPISVPSAEGVTIPAAPIAAAPVPAFVPPAAEPAPTVLSRRAQRARRVEAEPQPVAEPELSPQPLAATEAPVFRTAPIAPVDEPAPLLESVLAPAEPFELIEPAIDDPLPSVTDTQGEPRWVDEQPRVEASDVDEFEAAARLFAFTGETPIQAADADDEAGSALTGSHVVTRRSGVAALKRATAVSFSVGVMGIVGLLTVGMTTPAEAVAAASGVDYPVSVVAPAGEDVEVIPEDQIQAYVAPSSTESAAVTRNETYDTVTMAEIASESGISNFSNFFINDPNAAIQWPFAVGVPISYGFGMRDGQMHEGVDFIPGAGSPIQAIADGVVRVATESGGAYGVHVIIDHVIDGQLISSHYAHMQYGSLQVQVGQQVGVGTFLGRTGNTGRSYGAHTHFELLMGGTAAIDPIPWLRDHTGG